MRQSRAIFRRSAGSCFARKSSAPGPQTGCRSEIWLTSIPRPDRSSSYCWSPGLGDNSANEPEMTETKQLPLSERRLPASIGLGGSDLKPNRGFDFRPRLLPPEKARFRPDLSGSR
jgi:hypothetical protein